MLYSVRNGSSLRVIQLLVELRLHRSSSFVEFWISLTLIRIFDDFLFELTFRVDISTSGQFVASKWCSSLVGFHISISPDRKFDILIFEMSRHFPPPSLIHKWTSIESLPTSKAIKITSSEQQLHDDVFIKRRHQRCVSVVNS